MPLPAVRNTLGSQPFQVLGHCLQELPVKSVQPPFCCKLRVPGNCGCSDQFHVFPFYRLLSLYDFVRRVKIYKICLRNFECLISIEFSGGRRCTYSFLPRASQRLTSRLTTQKARPPRALRVRGDPPALEKLYKNITGTLILAC